MLELVEKELNKFLEKYNWKNVEEADWYWISIYRYLSESFIREFQNKVHWYLISQYHHLSESFIKEFKDKIDIEIQKKNFAPKSLKQKKLEVKQYAKKYHLKVDNKYLYAFRNHDKCGRGMYKKTIFYEKGKYYRDWHCNMNPYNENSFGLGIFPTGNTPVKVKIEDWGVAVNRNDGKARVMGFKII